MGLDLSDRQVGQLLEYASMLQKWGRVYNLTALRDEGEVLTHHLLDSLAVIEPLRQRLDSGPAKLLVSVQHDGTTAKANLRSAGETPEHEQVRAILDQLGRTA